MPGNLLRSDLARWARRNLARLCGGRGRPYGRFRLSQQLSAPEHRLLCRWVDALGPALRARLPQMKVVPVHSILRYGSKILLDAETLPSRALPAGGDRSTQAVSYVRERVLVLHRRLFRQRWLGQRLFYHELCHFLWPRLGARARQRFVAHLRHELARRVRGELGYTAQYRKTRLGRRDRNAWREYVCESFCDTGAYALARAAPMKSRHLRSVEFTLAPRHRPPRLAAWGRALAR